MAELTKTDRQKFWSDQVSNSIKVHKPFWRQGKDVLNIYRAGRRDFGHRNHDLSHSTDGPKVNILYANTQILAPAVLSVLPTPDIRKAVHEQNNADPVTGDPNNEAANDRLKAANQVSMIFERYCSFVSDQSRFQNAIINVRDDYLIPGRGIIWFNYLAKMGEVNLTKQQEIVRDGNGLAIADESGEVRQEEFFVDEDGNRREPDRFDPAQIDVKLSERVTFEHVFYRDFIHAVDDKLVQDSEEKEKSIRNWSDVWWCARRHPMTKKEIQTTFPESRKLTLFMGDTDRFDVWEIWDKRSRKRIWMSEASRDIFREEEVPFNIKGFFPVPKPLEAVHTTDDIIPMPLYCIYRDQAEELNNVEERLAKNTRMMKWAGLYDGALPREFQDIGKLKDGEFKPTAEATALNDRGGLKNAVYTPPIGEISITIQTLSARRAQIIQNIQEMTGISDIIRGFSDPRDGVGTQRLKGAFGSLRLRPLRQPMEEFIRDSYRIIVGIATDKFDSETWENITNIGISDAMAEIMKGDKVLIDIETDATVLPNSEIDQVNSVQFGQLLIQMLTTAIQATQLAPETAPVLVESMKFIASQFKASRSLMDEIDQLGDILLQQGQAAVQMRMAQAASGDQEMQQEGELERQKLVAGLQKAQLDAQTKLQTALIGLQESQAKSAADLQETIVRQRGQNRSEALDVTAAGF